MKALILNVGSSSVKYDLFENGKDVKRGLIERIGEVKGRTYENAVREVFNEVGKVDIIAHRIVHGGLVKKTSLLNNKLIKKLENFSELAPLHNIPELKVVNICKKYKIKQYAVFDTGFHKTIPEFAKTYALPYTLCKKYNIERYGFHGQNHEYMYNEACRILKKKNLNVITCHLGSGCSITAVKNGKSVDTSMGFTPFEGLVMGTRGGNLDPGILLFLMKKGYNFKKLDNLLKFESGLKGISRVSNDVRDLLKSKDKKARLALDIFVYRLVKYIGAYYAVLGGEVDAVVFSGGIGENEAKIRRMIVNKLRFLKTRFLVVKAAEEKIIYKEVMKLIK